ncbi:MAG: cyclic nucleotide-binding domain-containing protein [Deltaproteobacteria bacterium]|nr:MAG: cyclic nucleotide-binding domain-containing protein [Deltaproteobacteria bacterium]
MNDRQLFERFGSTFPPGHVLFREGDAGSEMYVIQSGEVEISRALRGRDTVIAVLGPGEFFGEMAIVNNRPRSATATVRAEARLLVIDAKTFEAMLRGRAEIAVRMIKALAARLDRANQQIEILLLEDANHRVVQALRQLAADRAPLGEGAAVFIPVSMAALAARAALPETRVGEVVQKLADAQLVLPAPAAGVEEEGFVIPEVGRLVEFLEFLELRERFADPAGGDA